MNKLEELRKEIEDMEKIDFKSLSPIQLENYSNRLDEIFKESTNYLLNITKNNTDEQIPIDETV